MMGAGAGTILADPLQTLTLLVHITYIWCSTVGPRK